MKRVKEEFKNANNQQNNYYKCNCNQINSCKHKINNSS